MFQLKVSCFSSVPGMQQAYKVAFSSDSLAKGPRAIDSLTVKIPVTDWRNRSFPEWNGSDVRCSNESLIQKNVLFCIAHYYESISR